MNSEIRILVNFDFIVDLDIAMIKYIINQFEPNPHIDKSILDLEDDELKYRLINRESINPLTLLFPNDDVDDLYFELLDEDRVYFLYDYAQVYDTYLLLNTLVNNGTNMNIIIHCNHEYEKECIKFLNEHTGSSFKTLTCKFEDIKTEKYDVFYVKYFAQLGRYRNMEGKHIYLANARYNMEKGKDVPILSFSMIFGDINLIHTMDLYKKIKMDYIEEHEEINPSFSE